MKKEKKQRCKEKKNSKTILPWHTKGISGLRENRLQMLLPKPEEEMFTTWCTLYTKLVPAAARLDIFVVQHRRRTSTVKK